MIGVACLVFVASQWRSRFFENVQLHCGGPPVTVQVAYLEPEHPNTDSAMSAVVSVFGGPPGARHLLTSTNVGALSWPAYDEEFVRDQRSGEGFLVLELMIGGKANAGIFIFDGNRARAVVRGFGIQATDLRHGLLTDCAMARDVTYRTRPGEHSNPPVVRPLRFDAKSRTFRPGAWHVVIFNPPATADVRGARNGHTFRIHMAKRNFRLGSRRVTLREGGLNVGGLAAVGVANQETSDLKSEDNLRQLFMTELTSFRVWIDGKLVVVPGRLWKTCFDPNLPPTGRLSRDGRCLVVRMGGSDGDGSYEATWTIRLDGRCSRTVIGTG